MRQLLKKEQISNKLGCHQQNVKSNYGTDVTKLYQYTYRV